MSLLETVLMHLIRCFLMKTAHIACSVASLAMEAALL